MENVFSFCRYERLCLNKFCRMMRKRVWLLGVVGSLLFSCQGETKKTEVVECNFSEVINAAPKDIPLSTLASSIEYVPLETSDSVLLGKIWKVWRNGNRIVVLEDSGIWMFDGKGRFVKKVLWRGKGPGEIADIRNISAHVNSEGTFSVYADRFIQFDSTGRRVYESPLWGKLVKEYYYQVFGTDRRCWFTMMTYTTCDVVSTDTEWFRTGIKPEETFARKYRLKTVDSTATIPSYYSRYAWKPNITCDYLSFVDCETGEWGRLYPDGKREVTQQIDFGSGEQLSWVIYMNDIGGHLILRARQYPDKIVNILYDKQSGKFTNMRKIVNDLDKSGNYAYLSDITSDGAIYKVEDFGTFLSRAENSDEPRLKALVETLPDDSNPILEFFKLNRME